MNIKKALQNKTVKNAGWIIGGRVAHKALAFLIGILTARYLGPGNYGLINYAAAYITFFASVCTLGINSVIIKDFIDHPDQEGTAIGTALGLRALSSFFSALMIVGLVAIIDADEPVTIAVVALSSVGLIFRVFDTLNYWFQARLQSKYCVIATITSYVVVSVYKIVLLAAQMDVTWFAIATSVEYIVEAVFLMTVYRKKGGPRFFFSLYKAKQILSASSSFIISGLMVSIYAATDKFMLKQMLNDSAVGHYALAVSLSTTWAFVLQAVIDSVYPSVIQSYSQDQGLFRRKNRQLYALVFYTAMGMSLLITLLAEPIVRLLYGQAYLPAVQPLRIVVWYTAFSYLGVARNAWIVCENKQRYLKWIYIAAAAINVLLNGMLIPAWGASGAALASLITQISTTVLLPAFIPPLRENAGLMLDAVLLRDVFQRK